LSSASILFFSKSNISQEKSLVKKTDVDN